MYPRGETRSIPLMSSVHEVSTTSMAVLLGAALLAPVSGMLGACSCGENYRYAANTTLVDKGVKIKVGVEAVVSSGFTRGGMLTTQRYEITVTYPSRAAITIINYAEKDVMSHDALKKRVKNLAVRHSPDRKHLALDPGPFGTGIHLLHMMPKGPPYRLESFDKGVNVKQLSKLDWNKVPTPLEIARRSMLARLGKGEFCIDSDLGVTLHHNMASRPVAEAVLQIWPDCRDAHWLVEPAAKSKHLPEELLKALRHKIDTYLDESKPSALGLCGVAAVSKILGETKRRDRAYRALVSHWPDSDVHTGPFYVIAELPADVQKSLAARARKILADPKSEQYAKGYAKSVLKDVK
jgi:hypothetical protein